MALDLSWLDLGSLIFCFFGIIPGYFFSGVLVLSRFVASGVTDLDM